MSEPAAPLTFGAEELASVESFRRLKDTAVLTIMFTDIEGFTELTDTQGEVASNELRRAHDRLLEGIITRGDAGLVVKRIGDAIMAVFSEPSTAVERAVEIQGALEARNRDRHGADPLRVRIGLDMGQVTVEERVDADVFGRHVNRASRIEGLAAGGQVYMSYTVFDSARGWLSGVAHRVEWTSHGRYRLKGVADPVEVFEVVDPELRPLRAPRGGQRVRSVPGLAWAAGFVLMGVAATIGYLQLEATEVYLTDYGIPRSYLDAVTEVVLGGRDGDGSRLLLADVRPGLHVLHYDVADGVRYYAALEVQRGENRIRPEWVESRLPSVYRYVGVGEPREEGTSGGAYFVYDAANRRIEHETELSISVESSRSPDDPDLLAATTSWGMVLDGETIARETRTYQNSIASREELEEEIPLFEDEFQRYWVEVRLVREFAHLSIESALKPPGG